MNYLYYALMFMLGWALVWVVYGIFTTPEPKCKDGFVLVHNNCLNGYKP